MCDLLWSFVCFVVEAGRAPSYLELLLAGGHVDVRPPDDQPLSGGLLSGSGPVGSGLRRRKNKDVMPVFLQH